MRDFYREISLLLANSIANHHPDNFDTEIKPLGLYRRVLILLECMVGQLGRLLSREISGLVISRHNFYFNNLSRFEATFNLLCDESSRKKYIELLAYRMLGFTKVKLSLNQPEFWSGRAAVATYRQQGKLPASSKKGYLELYDLSKAGYDGLRLYFVQNGIFVDFVLQQYNYNDRICVNKGDVVIDAGACWGDTALYFAARGAERILAYEFIPSNIAIFNQNMGLNPQLAGRIELVEKAVWETSGVDLSFEDRGAASRVAAAGVYSGITRTLSIDDLVRERGLSTVDFIKMDIEGAEFPALKGAAETIRQYKPKLAISVYHQPDDLIVIPAYIQSLNPDYELYLDYFTIVGDEIMLYAVDKHAQ